MTLAQLKAQLFADTELMQPLAGEAGRRPWNSGAQKLFLAPEKHALCHYFTNIYWAPDNNLGRPIRERRWSG
jgi:hypothetical protein